MNYSDPENVSPIWKIGDLILDRYEIKQIFTGGGMGLVYRVHHRDWSMDLAVKSPRPEFFQTQQQIENFEREAESWVSLGLHPHIASCYYVRRLGGIPRIFADFVEGGTLADRIRTKQLYEGGKESWLERVVDIGIQFARGLHHAHQSGLVHQDVKPANALLSLNGIVKVTDFGLANARCLSNETTTVARHPSQSILVPGAGFMTREYASPEQFRGEHLTRKTDIWSWAVSVLEMLVGEMTWTSGLAAPLVLKEIRDEHIFDEKLLAILDRCLAMEAHTRFESFEFVIDALIRYYTSRFGSYHREIPYAADLSSDEINNRAVSMWDLGKNEDALLTLEKALAADPTHVAATYNYALINRRLGYKSDAFGRDALTGLLHQDPKNLTSVAANALFCMERGVPFRSHHFHQQLCAASEAETPYLIEVEALLKDLSDAERQPPYTLKLCDSSIRNLQVSRDGRYLIVTDPCGCLASYDAQTGAPLVTLDEGYQFLRWTENNDALLQHSNRVFQWNLNQKPKLFELFCIEIPENDHFAISPSGNRCFIASGDTLTMFDASTGAILWEHDLEDMTMDSDGHFVEYQVWNVAFSPSGEYVAVATSRDITSMEVFDAENGELSDYQDHRGELLLFAEDFILTTDSCNTAHPLVTWSLLDFSQVGGNGPQNHITVQGIHKIIPGSRLGLPSGPANFIAVLTPDRCIQLLRPPQLTEVAELRWSELIAHTSIKGAPVSIGSDSQVWYIATSEGEVVVFRWSEPRRVPLMVVRPSSHEYLSERWRMQTNLIDLANRSFAIGEFAKALEMSRLAVSIRGGRGLDAAQLHDRVTALGRKKRVQGMRLAFDLERTILGGQFQLLDVSHDGRCALVERTFYRQGENCTGDQYRIVHLPYGRIEALPQIAKEGKLLRKISKKKDCIIVGTKTGLSVVPISGGSLRELKAPPTWAPTVYQGSAVSDPSYYASDLQHALQGEVIVASDLAAAWCSDKERCEEWHLYLPNGGDAHRIHTDTSHLRVMPDGFHAYAATPNGICWMWWPFRNAFQTFGYPGGVFGASANHIKKRDLSLDVIAFNSDGNRLFFGDSNGGLHIWNVKSDYYRGWKRFNAHSAGIIRVITGTDSRLVATVAADGLKIWDGTDMTLLFEHEHLMPHWISDDFRFFAEQSGCMWEIEWDYTFEDHPERNQLMREHVEGYLKVRRALAQISGETLTWGPADEEALAHRLAGCGFGCVTPEEASDLVRRSFSYLLN